jgi:hypothetical protein
MAQPGAFAGGPLGFLGGIGNAIGGLFGGGGQGPQLTAGGNQVAQAMTGGQGGQGQPAPAPGAPQGAQGGMDAQMQTIMAVLANPYAPPEIRQYALQLLERRQQANLPGEWKVIGTDPDSGKEVYGWVNPYRGGPPVPYHVEGGAPAAPTGGQGAPTGEGGAAPAPLDGMTDDQKKAWVNAHAMPEEPLPPKPVGMTMGQYNTFLLDRGLVLNYKDIQGLQEQNSKSQGFTTYKNTLDTWNAMQRHLADRSKAGDYGILNAYLSIMNPKASKPQSQQELEEQLRTSGLPGQILSKFWSVLQGEGSLTREERISLAENAQIRMKQFQRDWNNEAISMVGQAKRYHVRHPDDVLPTAGAMDPFDKNNVVEPRAAGPSTGSGGEKPSASQDSPPDDYPDAFRGKDGKWHVIRNGKSYTVNP